MKGMSQNAERIAPMSSRVYSGEWCGESVRIRLNPSEGWMGIKSAANRERTWKGWYFGRRIITGGRVSGGGS